MRRTIPAAKRIKELCCTATPRPALPAAHNIIGLGETLLHTRRGVSGGGQRPLPRLTRTIQRVQSGRRVCVKRGSVSRGAHPEAERLLCVAQSGSRFPQPGKLNQDAHWPRRKAAGVADKRIGSSFGPWLVTQPRSPSIAQLWTSLARFFSAWLALSPSVPDSLRSPVPLADHWATRGDRGGQSLCAYLVSPAAPGQRRTKSAARSLLAAHHTHEGLSWTGESRELRDPNRRRLFARSRLLGCKFRITSVSCTCGSGFTNTG